MGSVFLYKWCQFSLCFLFLLFSFSLFLSSQSYALYITGDENATSTDVSKYLAKLSAGVCVFVTTLKFILHVFDDIPTLCVFLTEPFDSVCVCVFVHVNIYWQPALITCQSHSSPLQGPVTHKERWHMYVCHHLFLLPNLTQCGADSRYLIGPFSHWHRIDHWLCRLCERVQRGFFCLFFIFL